MSGTTTTTSDTDAYAHADATPAQEAAAYCAEVGRHLGMLSDEDRNDLLDELVAHLTDVAAEEGAPLIYRLGPPSDYAAELLAAEGVVDVGGAPPLEWRDRLAGSPIGRLLAWLRTSPAAGIVGELRPVLVPVWVVARGYLAVSLLTAISLGTHFPGVPIPRLLHSTVVGGIAVLVAVFGSIRWQQRVRPGPRRWGTVVADVVLALFAVLLLTSSTRPVRYIINEPPAAPTSSCLLNGAGRPITNIYGYNAAGDLLSDVLLYDQDGHPIDNLCPNFDSQGRQLGTEYRRDVNNAPVINAFPRRQQIIPAPGVGGGAGSAGLATPIDPPAVVVPRLAPTPTTTLAKLPATATDPVPRPSGD
jgi:hypothetical protein